MKAPHVSVVIPCFNEARHLPAVLAALEAQTFRDFEIVLADGGSTDDTVEVARRWSQSAAALPLRVIPNPQRHIPHALNAGIAAARGEIIIRLDGHSYPQPDYVASCLRALDESGAAMVGGALDVQSGAPTALAEAIALAVTSPLGAGDAAYRLGASTGREVETVPFGCFARALWEKLGGYNEVLLTNEDYEFAERVRASGGRVWLDPRIRFRYVARATLPDLARQYWRYGWWKAQMLRRYPRSLRWRQAVPMAWSGAAVILTLSAIVWSPFAWLCGMAWLAYLGALLAFTARAAHTRWRLWMPLLAAFVTIHFAWGWGVWVGAVSGAVRRKRLALE
ncbi:MAG: glycosyltransferase family 2 protein [Anaerolineales bacterium]